MRTLKDIWKLAKMGLMIYGGYCLITGAASKKIKENWNDILDGVEKKVGGFFGIDIQKPIEVEYKVEDV